MYSVREVSEVLGISIARVRSYLRSGMVVPTRATNGRMCFSFKDLVLLREAEGLVAQRIAPRRIHDALRALIHRLPKNVNVAGVRLLGEGKEVVVDDGANRWHPLSGQTLLDFSPHAAEQEEVSVIPLVHAKAPSASPSPPESLTVQELHERACAFENTAPEEAKAAYRAVLEREPEFAEAHVNLGRLLHESGDIYAALVHYRAALAIHPNDATAAFNAGVALEDLGANADAIAAYRRAIESNPRNPDAHYNLARLLEQAGKPDLAVRHLLLYRQLTRKR